MPTATQPVVMSVQQFCEWSSIGRTKVYEEIASSRLKTLKVGRRRLIKCDDRTSSAMSDTGSGRRYSGLGP
ncbi:hypothetical protein D3C73_75510 [compost metagenome]